MRRRVRLKHAAALAAGLVGVALGTTATARPETRTLRLYHINLHESSEIIFKRDGKYLPDGLKKANWALRDWRRNQPTTMDPRLLDLLWEAYQKSGSHMPIHVIGGFRAPETNHMLRSRSAHTGVAEHSQHMLGKAVDFFIPDVPLARLREIGLKMQIGGVGFYPRSGAPFVHFDVGSGRYWPRMSRQELARIFPDGKTIHLPTDGKPMPGYAEAMASYKKRKGASELMVADAGSTAPRRSFLAALFGGGRDEAEDEAETSAAPMLAKKASPPPAPAPATTPAPEPAQAKPKPAELPPGVAMADAGAFDASAPKREEVAVAALVQPQRVPLPTHAPARTPAPEEPNPIDAVLVAALAEEPAADVALPHGIPMPHERPVAGGAASEIAQEMAAAVPPAAAAPPAPMLAAAFAPEPTPAIHVPAPHTRPPILEASLDRRHAAPVVVPATAAATTARGSRVAGTMRAQKRAAASRPSGSQTAIAALLVDPERRALETAPTLPRAEKLVADRPHDVLALGFAPTGAKPGSAARFSGRAVNFLPVRHID